MADPIKRLHYFDHQFLRARDFTDEQTYHLSMRRAHNRLLHSCGVADGLVVTVAPGSSKAAISPGMAIDSQGREIALANQAETPELNAATGPEFWITIGYAEQESDSSGETGTTGNTRSTELAVIEALSSAPADPGFKLILARVTVAGDGSLIADDGVDPNRRRYASTVGGDFTARSVTLVDPNVVATEWPRFSISAGGRADLNSSLSVQGPVGIGTSAPTHPLHVTGPLGIRQNDLYFSGGAGSGCSFSYNAHRDAQNRSWVFPNPDSTSVTVEMDAKGPGDTPRFEIYGTTTAARNSWMRRLHINCETGNILICQAGGQLGVGVEPDFEGKIDVNGRMRVRQGSNHSAGIWFSQNAAANRAFVGMIDDNQVGFWGAGGWGLLMNASTLRVNFPQAITAAGAQYPSDVRLKSDITPIAEALEKISRIRGVSYTMADDQAAPREVGVIAQEVEKVVPEIVHTGEEDGMKTVDYGRLAAVLVEAVKELKQQTEKLRLRVAELESAKA